MERKRNTTPTIQIIVRRGALRRFASLDAKRGELPVALLWDRRLSERRSETGRPAGERRRRERRREPPFTWTTAEFVVVEAPAAQEEKAAKKPSARAAKPPSRKKTAKKR